MVLCTLKDCIERLDVVAAIGREEIAQSKRAGITSVIVILNPLQETIIAF